MTSPERKAQREQEKEALMSAGVRTLAIIPPTMPERARNILVCSAFMGATETARYLGINRSRVNAIRQKYGHLLPALVEIRESILHSKALAGAHMAVDKVAEYLGSGKAQVGSVTEATQLMSVATQLSKVSQSHKTPSATDPKELQETTAKAAKVLDSVPIRDS